MQSFYKMPFFCSFNTFFIRLDFFSEMKITFLHFFKLIDFIFYSSFRLTQLSRKYRTSPDTLSPCQHRFPIINIFPKGDTFVTIDEPYWYININ